MLAVTILPVSETNGDRSYRAVFGDKQSAGKTAGQALDALFGQLDNVEFGGPLVIQSFQADTLFTAAQKKRLQELMDQWRLARDKGHKFPSAQQEELDILVQAELKAATTRSIAVAEQRNL